jgi:hypothetical protein
MDGPPVTRLAVVGRADPVAPRSGPANEKKCTVPCNGSCSGSLLRCWRDSSPHLARPSSRLCFSATRGALHNPQAFPSLGTRFVGALRHCLKRAQTECPSESVYSLERDRPRIRQLDQSAAHSLDHVLDRGRGGSCRGTRRPPRATGTPRRSAPGHRSGLRTNRGCLHAATSNRL